MKKLVLPLMAVSGLLLASCAPQYTPPPTPAPAPTKPKPKPAAKPSTPSTIQSDRPSQYGRDDFIEPVSPSDMMESSPF